MSEWISVKDALPDHEDEVLVWNSYEGQNEIGKMICGKIHAYIDREFQEFDNISHWIPLPEPPKE